MTGDLSLAFIESPIYDNWFKRLQPEKSLIICSPYVKRNALDRIIKLYDIDKRDKSFDFKLLLRGNSEDFMANKSSDIAVFDSLLSVNAVDVSKIRRVQNLHMKAYSADRQRQSNQ